MFQGSRVQGAAPCPVPPPTGTEGRAYAAIGHPGGTTIPHALTPPRP
jgi:hypothetical protein